MSGKGAKGLITGKYSAATNKDKDKKKPVSPSSRAGLQLAIRGDEELDTLINGTIAGAGVIPHIYKSLIKESSKD